MGYAGGWEHVGTLVVSSMLLETLKSFVWRPHWTRSLVVGMAKVVVVVGAEKQEK